MATSLEQRIVGMLAPSGCADASLTANNYAAVTDALKRNRVLVLDVPVEWEPSISSTGRMQRVRASIPGLWGECRAMTDTTQGATDPDTRIIGGLGVSITGWTLSEDGWITYATDQSATGTQFVTTWGYDVYSAAADVADWMVANRAQSFAFTSGDDQFKPGEAADRLLAMAQGFRRQAIPRRIQRRRTDTVGSMTYVPRSRAGNDL